MATQRLTSGKARFSAFEVDLGTGEVRKHGLRVRLQDQPFQVLAALIERPGEIVTREQLVRRLWADGTLVDYEGGLNAAVTRLRQALSDSAETPRYIETVAKRGYRWIASVERCDDPQPSPVAAVTAPPSPSRPAPMRRSMLLAAITGFAILLGTVAWFALGPHSRAQHSIAISPLTSGLGSERNVSFSPDGTQIVYEWEQEDHRRRIYIKEAGAGDPVPLTSGTSAEYGPEWSPDGRLIAFLRARGPVDLDLYVVPPVGGLERKIATVAAPDGMILARFVRRMAWTAGAKHLIVSAPDRDGHGEGLLLVSVADGTKRWLTDPKPNAISGDREPAVSPDGREVAFARGQVGASEMLWLLPLTSDLRPAGSPRPLPDAGRCRSPAWSPDGKELLFTGVSPGMAGSGFSKIRVQGGAPVSVPVGEITAATPAVSRIGAVAFSRVRIESSIWRQEVGAEGRAAGPPVRLTRAAAADGNADYSPDGRRIVFGSNRSGTREIWTCEVDGAHCRALTSFGASYATGSPHWSPDGSQIAFDSGAAGRMHIYIVDANGGVPRRLTGDRTGGAVPNWSRDGAWVYFSSARSGATEIWKVPRAGGDPVRISRSGGFYAMEAPDAAALFYTKTAEHADLFRSEMDGSGERLVLRGVSKRGFVIAADRIYYLHQDSDTLVSLRAFMLRTGENRVVAGLVEPLFLGLALSPGGRYLIYSPMRIASNLMLADGVFH